MSDDDHTRAVLNGLPESPSAFSCDSELRHQAPTETQKYIAELKRTGRYSKYEIGDLVLAWERDREETAARDRKAARLPSVAQHQRGRDVSAHTSADDGPSREREHRTGALSDYDLQTDKRVRIAERDDWHCWLCGGATSREWPRRLPPPLAPTLDHVNPKSRGGGRSMKNLRLAHYHCNFTRGNHSPEWAWAALASWAVLQGFDREYDHAPARTHGLETT